MSEANDPQHAHPGLAELFRYPLMSAIVERRSRRVSRGTSIAAGDLSHQSTNAPAPLSALEEAVLIVTTGLTGFLLHDGPVDGGKELGTGSYFMQLQARAANSQSTLAVPAQAIKSAIAAQLASDKNQSSNNYRVLENRNINATIHQHPVAGIGFGQKFSIVVPMPDISQIFEWWEYITHNSIMWIWMKAGIGGFFSLLCLIGLGVVSGVGALERLREPNLRAITLTATLYLVMHFIYACVDMSWDSKSTVLVGAMMGVINCTDWIEARR